MSWRTNSLVLVLRNIGRTLGLNKRIASYLLGQGYETRYDNSFSSALRQGDCVWDVGANVGYYTRLFSERVGKQGRVFAFEPSPVNFVRLASACASLGNATLLQCGLGKEDGKLRFQQGADDLGATSRIVEDDSEGVVVVDIRSGVSLLDGGEASVPNAIKIDVEGFEHEVLEGLGEHIKKPDVRLIGIEVHFRILKERGVPHVPQQIETLLNHHGFSVSWPDPSHIIALRNT
ncbi:FkbM family methyltransferase [Methylococcus mesophilus]|uniref:FkbM family methyltransferase n=1 Tax=Methylococcus mesophilus TaxID=2993564 RepID=UPI00224B65BD|nr:FkbM family methyltransferase [Methylococcus mesophilus]UZR28739.1 FkbM family methyltransferase [Methylococcus mesophilus]